MTFEKTGADANRGGRPRKGQAPRDVIRAWPKRDWQALFSTAFQRSIAGDSRWAVFTWNAYRDAVELADQADEIDQIKQVLRDMGKL